MSRNRQHHPTSPAKFNRRNVEILVAQIVKSPELAQRILRDERAYTSYRLEFQSIADLYRANRRDLDHQMSRGAIIKFLRDLQRGLRAHQSDIKRVHSTRELLAQLRGPPDWQPPLSALDDQSPEAWRFFPSGVIDEQILRPYARLAVQLDSCISATIGAFRNEKGSTKGAPRKFAFDYLIGRLAKAYTAIPEGVSDATLDLYRQANLTTPKGSIDAPKGREIGSFVKFVRAFLDIAEPEVPHQALPKRVGTALRKLRESDWQIAPSTQDALARQFGDLFLRWKGKKQIEK